MVTSFMKGLEQNQNKALNGVLRSTCSKSKFAGRGNVVSAVCDTINIFNTGAGFKADLFENLGVHPGRNLVRADEIEDSNRNKAADRKISPSSCIYRRKRRSEKRKKEETTTTTYFPGAFGTSKTPLKPLQGARLNRSPSFSLWFSIVYG